MRSQATAACTVGGARLTLRTAQWTGATSMIRGPAVSRAGWALPCELLPNSVKDISIATPSDVRRPPDAHARGHGMHSVQIRHADSHPCALLFTYSEFGAYSSSMTDVKSRRQEHADATRDAVLDSARSLFITAGYAATSTEQVVHDARVSRGALYHHFGSKTDLFIAVFVQVETETMQRLTDALGAVPDPWEAAMAALDAYLEACLHPAYHRIVLEEGPVALGWKRWRELDQHHTLKPIEQILQALITNGHLSPQPVSLLARIICAATGEAAVAVADSAQPAAARNEAAGVLRDLFDGLRHHQVPSASGRRGALL